MELQNEDLAIKVASFIKREHPRLKSLKWVRDVRINASINDIFDYDSVYNHLKKPTDGIEFVFSTSYFIYDINKNTLERRSTNSEGDIRKFKNVI